MIATGTIAPGFITWDPGFGAVLGRSPRLERVLETDAHEGPVYVAEEDALFFTTLPRPGADGPRVDIARLSLDGERFPIDPRRLRTVRPDANAANGMSLDREGLLLVCEQGSLSRPAALTRVDRRSGAVVDTVADAVGGSPLNSPNDVVEGADGAVWFTDPSYGQLQGFRPEPRVGDLLLRVDPRHGEVEAVVDDFDKPNGIALSPDGSVLYVTDSGANQEPGSLYDDRPHHVRAFDVGPAGRLSDDRVLAEVQPGFPDGLECDSEGRVYVSSFSGVQVLAPDGTPLGEIHLPGAVNFVFGGPGRNVLFITADHAIWAAVLAATGPKGA